MTQVASRTLLKSLPPPRYLHSTPKLKLKTVSDSMHEIEIGSKSSHSLAHPFSSAAPRPPPPSVFVVVGKIRRGRMLQPLLYPSSMVQITLHPDSKPFVIMKNRYYSKSSQSLSNNLVKDFPERAAAEPLDNEPHLVAEQMLVAGAILLLLFVLVLVCGPCSIIHQRAATASPPRWGSNLGGGLFKSINYSLIEKKSSRRGGNFLHSLTAHIARCLVTQLLSKILWCL